MTCSLILMQQSESIINKTEKQQHKENKTNKVAAAHTE
jgi:hypothetical protein